MSLVTNNTGWVEASVPSPASRGVDRRTVVADVTLSDDYEAGGEGVVLPEGIGDLRALTITPNVVGGYVLSWDGDPDDPMVLVNEVVSTYDPGDPEADPVVDPSVTSTLSEVADETDLSTHTVTLMAVFEK
jgi:hypothetical protein